MPEPTPIKPGVTPQFDAQREVLDWCVMQLRRWDGDAKTTPEGVVMVMFGRANGQLHTITNSWSPTDSRSRFETCSIAAALLTERALKSS
jgi:hypothetical protein